MRSKRFFSAVVAGVLFVAMIFMPVGVTGCSPEDIAQYQQDRAKVETYRIATTQAVTDIEAEIALLPPDDPLRKAAESKLVKLKAALDKLDEFVPKIDAAIAAVQAGNVTDPALRDAAGAIPYGNLALTVGLAVYGIWQRNQRQKVSKGLDQTVTGLQEALPKLTKDSADVVKNALARSQDEEVKKIVATLKA